MALISILFGICTFLIAYTSSNTYSQTLTPSDPNTNGISVITSFSEVLTNNDEDEWIVTIKSQNTWQFIIDLGDKYAFDPDGISTIKFTVNSPNPTNDILFGFSTDNDQFISTWIPMNNDGRKNHIHPQCDTSKTPTATFSKGDIYTLPQINRHCDIAPGNDKHGCKWDSFQPKNAQNPKIFHYNAFPITYIFTNNPIDNIFTISYKSAEFEPEFIQKCGFTSISSKSFKIYIAGGEIGDTFTVSSFVVEYDGNTSKSQESPIPQQALQNRWRMVEPSGNVHEEIESNPVKAMVYTSDNAESLQYELAAQSTHDITAKDGGDAGIIVSVTLLICICGSCTLWLNRWCILNSTFKEELNENMQKSDDTESESTSGSLSSLSRTLSDQAGYEQETEDDTISNTMNESDTDTDPLDDDHEYKYEYEYEDDMDDMVEMMENVVAFKVSDNVRVNHERINAMSMNMHLSVSDDIMDHRKYSQDSMISDVNGDMLSGEKEHEREHSMLETEVNMLEKSHSRMNSGIPQFDENEAMDVPNDLLDDMYGSLM